MPTFRVTFSKDGEQASLVVRAADEQEAVGRAYEHRESIPDVFLEGYVGVPLIERLGD